MRDLIKHDANSRSVDAHDKKNTKTGEPRDRGPPREQVTE